MRIIISAFALLFVVSGSRTSFAGETKEYYSKNNLPPKLIEEISKDECKPNLIGFDVCKKARELADEMSQQLPMKLSNELLVEKVFADKGVISLTAVLGYDESYLKSAAQDGGITMQDLLNKLKQGTANLMCQPKSATAAFINLGGKLQYQYQFNNRAPYATVNIDRTLCQLKK
jgi:hypothetical protein